MHNRCWIHYCVTSLGTALSAQASYCVPFTYEEIEILREKVVRGNLVLGLTPDSLTRATTTQ